MSRQETLDAINSRKLIDAQLAECREELQRVRVSLTARRRSIWTAS